MKETFAKSFWDTLKGVVRDRGIAQEALARALRMSPSRLAQRGLADSILPHWRDEVIPAIEALRLEAHADDLQQHLREGVLAKHGLPAEGEGEHWTIVWERGSAAHEAGNEREALRLLRSAHRAGRAGGDRERDAWIQCSLELSACLGNLGEYQEALTIAQEAATVSLAVSKPRQQFLARHQVALMQRRAAEWDGRESWRSFEFLICDYQHASAEVCGQDSIARALRDGARALAREPGRWSDVEDLHDASLRVAERCGERSLQQQFHTRLDAASLACLKGDRQPARKHCDAAERLLLEAMQAAEPWITPRDQAKYGLVSALVTGVDGRIDEATAGASAWRRRAFELGYSDYVSQAEELLEWLEVPEPHLLRPAAFLP